MMTVADWFWPASTDEAKYISETGLTLWFPPAQPIEVREIPEDGEQ